MVNESTKRQNDGKRNGKRQNRISIGNILEEFLQQIVDVFSFALQFKGVTQLTRSRTTRIYYKLTFYRHRIQGNKAKAVSLTNRIRTMRNTRKTYFSEIQYSAQWEMHNF